MKEKDIGSELGYRLAVEEMQRLFTAQMDTLDGIKANAQNILGAASLIVALVGALQIFNTSPHPAYTLYYDILVIGISCLYVIMVVCCIWALFLVHVNMPVQADWDEIFETYINHTNTVDLYRQQLSNLLNVLELNKPIAARRTRLVNIATILLPIIVVLLFVLSLF